jgi:hypothetical protein
MSYLLFLLLLLLKRKVLPNKSNYGQCFITILKLYSKTRLVLQECLKGILKNKTVLLVTHQVDFLQNVDTIIVSFFFELSTLQFGEHILVLCCVLACDSPIGLLTKRGYYTCKFFERPIVI